MTYKVKLEKDFETGVGTSVWDGPELIKRRSYRMVLDVSPGYSQNTPRSPERYPPLIASELAANLPPAGFDIAYLCT